MGVCFSAQVKAESPYNTGSNPRYDSTDAGETGSIFSSKVSSFSVIPTLGSEGELLQASNLNNFTFADLKLATRDFRLDSVLGEGGFGSVYKGWVHEQTLAASKPGTGIVIAVKKLNHESRYREWLAEVSFLGQLYHPNLVKLVGYCLEDEQRLLVYECMPRGSLKNHLFMRGSYFQPLPWNLRLKVAVGAAKGLAFLHSPEVKFIYGGFKSSSILLDWNYNAKLSDFGLAKDGPTDDKSHVAARVMGTYGYAAPEYISTGHLTAKSDVYSFGVVLLEMLSGRRAIDKNRLSRETSLVEWAKPYLANKRKVLRIIDNRLEGQYTIDDAHKVATLVLRCLSTDAKFRPTMDQVVKLLEGLHDPSEPSPAQTKPARTRNTEGFAQAQSANAT